MDVTTPDPTTLELQAQNLGRKAWLALIIGAIGVPVCSLLFAFTLFSGPLGENGTNNAAFLFLATFIIGFVATPILTVMWSVGSYRADRHAHLEVDAPRPLKRLLPIAVATIPVFLWVFGDHTTYWPT